MSKDFRGVVYNCLVVNYLVYHFNRWLHCNKYLILSYLAADELISPFGGRFPWTALMYYCIGLWTWVLTK